MNENSWWQHKIPLVQSVAWIVVSVILCTSFGYASLQYFVHSKQNKKTSPTYFLKWIVQTGPEKEPLKSIYLCELLDLSVDKPINIYQYDLQNAEKKLLSSPIIKKASVKLIPPNTIYIDYTARTPLAWFYDYTNTFIDAEGYLFPVVPFFSPKTLPEIYLGVQDNIKSASLLERVQGKHIDLGFAILQYLDQSVFRDAFTVKRIDVSSAFAESYGKREIVLKIVEDLIDEGKEDKNVKLPIILRLSTKGYKQELVNYLQLRTKFREAPITTVHEKIIDFRIPQLAFIDDGKEVL
ncbi:MAG: FtsQ-type POTRA domain-containing protein [Chlamydiae bacterium]|nr:FtsQ-type POTRA domain-containing protein [Chlamydiota bacterium]